MKGTTRAREMQIMVPHVRKRRCALEYTLGILAWISTNASVYSLSIGHCSLVSTCSDLLW